MSEIKRKEKKKFYKKLAFWLPWLTFAVVIVVAIILMTWVKKNTKEYTPKEKFIRYSMGSKIFYDEELVLKRDGDTTYFEFDDSVESDGTPLVYEGSHKYLLPVNMAYINPNAEMGTKRVNYFSTVSWNSEEKKATVAHNDREVDVTEGFMYDGNGTFIFIEETDLVIGSMKYHMSPMSYVRVYYKDSVEILNLLEDEYQYIELTGNKDVTGVCQNGYSINLGTNVMTVNDAPRILFSNIDAMGVLE